MRAFSDTVRTRLNRLLVYPVESFKRAEGTKEAEFDGDNPNQESAPKPVPQKLGGKQ